MIKHAFLAGVFLAVANVALAGDLEPSAPPASTMKSLDDIYGAWSRILTASERFVLVMSNDEAVLDRETNLVWQRTPGTANYQYLYLGVLACGNSLTGGRGGWRLPTSAELMTLIDPSVVTAPFLPVGHPFLGSVGSVFMSSEWSPVGETLSTRETIKDIRFHYVGFSASPGTNVGSTTELASGRAWCVRGPD